jgi:hypothetical protein
MKNALTTLLLVLFFGCSAAGARLKLSTRLIVTRIALNNKVMGSAVSAGGICPRQYKNFEALERNASTAELHRLLQHHNSAVRCYAFWALTRRPDQDLLPYLLSKTGDKSKVETMFGCSTDDEYVTDFMIWLVTPGYCDNSTTKLHANQLELLDSFLICTPNVLSAQDDALERMTPKPALYNPVRQLVTRDNNQYALLALARFRQQEDIPLIRNNSTRTGADAYITFDAISLFPDTAFLPFVIASLHQALEKPASHAPWHSLYGAIAAYRNDTALYFLSNSLTTSFRLHQREQVQYAAYSALRSCAYPGYDPLLWTFWDSVLVVDPIVFRHLYQLAPEAALNRIGKTLQQPDRLSYPDPDMFLDTASERIDLLRVMLDTLIRHDRPLAYTIIRQNICDTRIRKVESFLDAAQSLRDAAFAAALLDRVRTETGPNIYNRAALALIAFKDAGINQRLLAAARQNPVLVSGWRADNFKLLLKEHHIE